MADQQFCLRWNNHQSTLVSVFDTLLENGVLVDCTLAAEGQSLKAHKVMLTACSPYLEHLLSQHYEKHPIIILKDIKFAELKSMIDYMYRGEVNISQDELGTFLKAAESLQIKGLTDNNEGDARDVGSTSKAPPPPRKSTLPASSTQLAEPQRPDATPASPGHRSRDGSISPTLRKRRRIRRHSQDDMGDNVLENSNSCDLPAQSTPIVPNIPLTSTTAPPMKATIVKPEQTELVNRIDTNLNSLPPESGLLKEKLEPEPLLLEPKTEYLDDNNDSVEDLTLDDDDDMDGMDVSQMSNLSNMSRPGPSHGNGSDISNQGFAPWHNQSGTDEVFMAAQEAVNNAHRDSQGHQMVASGAAGCGPMTVPMSQVPMLMKSDDNVKLPQSVPVSVYQDPKVLQSIPASVYQDPKLQQSVSAGYQDSKMSQMPNSVYQEQKLLQSVSAPVYQEKVQSVPAYQEKVQGVPASVYQEAKLPPMFEQIYVTEGNSNLQMRSEYAASVPCPQCHHKFYNQVEVEIHMASHHPRPPNPTPAPAPVLYKCLKCGKKYISEADWKLHLQQDCPPDVWCAFCSNKFYTKAELQSHCLLTHPNIRNLYMY